MQRYCKVCDGWHSLDRPWPHNCMPERNTARSDLPAPRFISDTMDPVQSQLDGKFYDSKSAIRATYKQAGVTEVGNDSSVLNPKPRKRPKPSKAEVRKDVERAFAQLS